MNSPIVKFKRTKETSFLIVDSIIFDKFSPYALKIYGQLRKLTSFNTECDEIEITVKRLAELSGCSERKAYGVLNELEFTHYIIQRTNNFHFRLGKTNSFTVSQTYNYFKDPLNSDVSPDVQVLTTPAPNAVPPAQYAEGTAQYADLIKQDLSQESFKKKQNKETPVSVFADADAVKTHLTAVIVKRNTFVEEDVIDQIIYYVGTERLFTKVSKKINIALKKVREGKWNIPNGWNGITSQSIRAAEEEYEKNKKEQTMQDAKIFREIAEKVGAVEPMKGFSNLLHMLKGRTNANTTGMQEHAV